MNSKFQIIGILYLFFSVFLFTSCQKEDFVVEDPVDRTVLVYMPANNNLSEYANQNIELMLSAASKGALNGGNLIVYLDDKKGNSQLIRITQSKGYEVIKKYEERNSANSIVLKEVIEDMMSMYPAKDYGLIFWGHGSGWMEGTTSQTMYNLQKRNLSGLPLTRAYGVDGNYWMNIDDLVEGIPDNMFHFILFDVCYMAGIETAYALRNKTEFLIASATEVMGNGYPYDLIIPHIYRNSLVLENICESFYHYYTQQAYPYASVSLIHSESLDSLDRVVKIIRNMYKEKYLLPDRTSIQQFGRYEFNNKFFDMNDFISNVVPTNSEEYKEFSNQLQLAIPYVNYTNSFFEIALEKYCGLSIYIPLPNEKNDFYDNLEWSKAINN